MCILAQRPENPVVDVANLRQPSNYNQRAIILAFTRPRMSLAIYTSQHCARLDRSLLPQQVFRRGFAECQDKMMASMMMTAMMVTMLVIYI